MPTSCQTLSTETTNEPSITIEARPPDIALGSRRPIVALTTKPRKGKSGMSANTSPLQRCKRVRVKRFLVSEQRNHQRQPDGGFGRGDSHHEEGDDLPVEVAGRAAERAKS